MQDNEELTWKQRYIRMKKHYGWTDAQIADRIDYSANSIRQNINGDLEARGKKFPSALRGMIVVFEIENKLTNHTIVI